MTVSPMYSVLQWNVWYLEDAHNIVTFLRDQDADIVCLQELTRGYDRQVVPDVAAFIAHELGYNYYTAWYPLTTGAYGGNGIFSRFQLHTTKQSWLLSQDSEEPRCYASCVIDLPGGAVTVATTHMLYTDAFIETPTKKIEADRLMQTVGPSPLRYILCADMNALPESYTVRQLSSRLQHAGPDTSEATWPTKPFRYNGFEALHTDRRLDYVFTSPDIHVVRAMLLETAYSDHLPVKVVFTV